MELYILNIAVSIIDYKLASLEQREIFALSKSRLCSLYESVKLNENIDGCVVLSTCNRTEIYVNMTEENDEKPYEILCDFVGVNSSDYSDKFHTFENEDAIFHLFKVASGLKSQIWGEDQIITQVKSSLIIAREYNAADPILEVLFRNAISGAKKVKSDIDFKTDNNSTAKCALNIILENKDVKKVLVIGNGEIGRLTAKLLVDFGIDTTMTLRKYKYSETVIPSHVVAVDYDLRYEKLKEVDAVVSATSSPHFTIEYEKLDVKERLPKVFIDLAVPRDIDPKIENVNNISYYNIDNLDSEHITYHKLIQQKQANDILRKYVDNFYKWYEYKTQLVQVNE